MKPSRPNSLQATDHCTLLQSAELTEYQTLLSSGTRPRGAIQPATAFGFKHLVRVTELFTLLFTARDNAVHLTARETRCNWGRSTSWCLYAKHWTCLQWTTLFLLSSISCFVWGSPPHALLAAIADHFKTTAAVVGHLENCKGPQCITGSTGSIVPVFTFPFVPFLPSDPSSCNLSLR